MKNLVISSIAAVLLSAPALADLEVGDVAPDFEADGYLGGEAFSFDLAEALSEGPVVLYFFPAAFTAGCNIEAGLFAQSAADFEAAGATLIGVTAGNTDRLQEFSEAHCASAFPVVAAEGSVLADYEVRLLMRPGWSDRSSFVIDENATIVFTHSDMSPNEHVSETLQALHDLQGMNTE
jgi:peroxiredoxin Q/BCP